MQKPQNQNASQNKSPLVSRVFGGVLAKVFPPLAFPREPVTLATDATLDTRIARVARGDQDSNGTGTTETEGEGQGVKQPRIRYSTIAEQSKRHHGRRSTRRGRQAPPPHPTP